MASKPRTIRIKVSWLKQKLAEGTRTPVLEFDEQQIFSFDPHLTTFKMVKHSCSYPAPPHKVRMWCSSFGAAAELPLSMELNVFINTFELITEERHTLAMAHLSGGETIAFEMVQNDHDSELSGFLMGSAMGKGGKGGTGPSSGGGTVLPMLLPGSSNTQDPAMDASAKANDDCDPNRVAEMKATSEKIAAELIAQEEEEKAKKEKKKAKKKGKKDKQKERKRALTGESAPTDHDCPHEVSGEASEPEEEDYSLLGDAQGNPARASSSGPVPAEVMAAEDAARSRCSSCNQQDTQDTAWMGHSDVGAKETIMSAFDRVDVVRPGSLEGARRAKGIKGADVDGENQRESRIQNKCKAAGGSGDVGSKLISLLTDALIDGASAGSILHNETGSEAALTLHIQKCHALIRALVEACAEERRRKQAMADQLHDFEQAAAAQHTEYSAELARLQSRIDDMERQALEKTRKSGGRS